MYIHQNSFWSMFHLRNLNDYVVKDNFHHDDVLLEHDDDHVVHDGDPYVYDNGAHDGCVHYDVHDDEDAHDDDVHDVGAHYDSGVYYVVHDCDLHDDVYDVDIFGNDDVFYGDVFGDDDDVYDVDVFGDDDVFYPDVYGDDVVFYGNLCFDPYDGEDAYNNGVHLWDILYHVHDYLYDDGAYETAYDVHSHAVHD